MQKKGEKNQIEKMLFELLGSSKAQEVKRVRKAKKMEVIQAKGIEATQARKERRDKGTIIISDRDRELLIWINEQMAVSIDHLRILLARTSENKEALADKTQVSLPQANRMIRRWQGAGLVNLDKINNRVWIWCSAKAIKDFELEYGFYEPSLWNHIYHVNKIRLNYESRGMKWTPERKLRREYGTGAKWKKHFPDGEITYKGNQIAVEVELSNKKTKDRARIIKQYADAFKFADKDGKNKGLFGYHYSWVFYFVVDKSEEVIREAVKDHTNIFQVKNLKDVSETQES